MKKQNPSAQDHGIRGRKRLETAQHSLQTGVYPTAVVFAAQAESDLFDAGDADAAGEAMAIRRQALRSLGAKQNPQSYFFVPGQTVEVRPHDTPGWVFRGIVGKQAPADTRLGSRFALKYPVSAKDGEDEGYFSASELRPTDLPPQTHEQVGAAFPAEIMAAHVATLALNRAKAKLAGDTDEGIKVRMVRPGSRKRNPDEDDFVKVHFPGEAMWVLQTGADTGILDNEPVSHLHDAKLGDEIQWRVQNLPRSKGQFLEFVRVVKRAAAKNPDEEILNMKQNPVTRAPNRTARPAPKGHYYKVLDRKGRVIAFTTTKAEAESVCPAGGRVQHL